MQYSALLLWKVLPCDWVSTLANANCTHMSIVGTTCNTFGLLSSVFIKMFSVIYEHLLLDL